MHLAKRRTLIFFILLIAGLLALQGCSANGYITASVQSVIGLDVSENPQTQVPHVRFGFIRNQLYYVPTGKVVVGQGGTSGEAKDVPHLVSYIKLNSTFAQSMEIEERFAVGDEASNSPAAQALFGAAQIVTPQPSDVYQLQLALKPLIRANPGKAKSCINGIASTFKGSPDLFVDAPPEPKKDNLQKLKDCMEKP